MNTSALATWFAQETAKGLVDIKLAVIPGKGISQEKIGQEIVAAELAIANKVVRDTPSAKSSIPEEIMAVFKTVNFAAAQA